MNDFSFEQAEADQLILDDIKNDIETFRNGFLKKSKNLSRNLGFEKSLNGYINDLLGDTVEYYELYTSLIISHEEEKMEIVERAMDNFRKL